MLTEPLQVTQDVANAFERLAIPYFVGGSVASTVHGVIRSTMDVDLVADLPVELVLPLAAELQNRFFVDTEMMLDAVLNTSSFNIVHIETMFKVDVFIMKQRPFDISQMKRRIAQVIGDSPETQAYFSTAEDIILAKLEWYRAGGETSERQWRDVLGIIELQWDRLDFEYLRHWAESLQVADLLEKSIQVASKNLRT